MATIKYPGKHDVMLGRGGESNYHSGNIAFRHMVQKYKERFRLGSRTEKNKVIDEVVSEWRHQDPEGRFVAKKTTESGEVVWYDVGNEQAKKRAAKSLAEWTPQASFGSSSSSSATRKSGKKSPSPERKRSRSAAGIDSSASGLGLQKHKFDGNKRQNVELASRFMLPSFSTADASRNQGNQREGQLPPLQQHQSFSLPLHLFPQPEQEVPSSAATTSSATARPAATSSGLALLDFALPGPGPAPTSSDHMSMPPPVPAALAQDFIVASSTTVGLNQLCSVGTNDSVLPIERIRLQIPTAAELSACAFSDEEKSSRSDSSRGSNHSYSLIPNKQEMTFKDTSSVVRHGSDMGCATFWVLH